MQESAQAAMSYVRSKAEEFSIPKNFNRTTDVHVHIPEGAIPKDGPSAGITLATVLVSALTKVAVRKDVAMTGEITLRGKVLPIGGVKEKVLAAHRAGVTNIIVPKDNEKDLADIPKNVLDAMNVHLVETMDDVLRIALAAPLPRRLPVQPEGQVGRHRRRRLRTDAVRPRTTPGRASSIPGGARELKVLGIDSSERGWRGRPAAGPVAATGARRALGQVDADQRGPPEGRADRAPPGKTRLLNLPEPPAGRPLDQLWWTCRVGYARGGEAARLVRRWSASKLSSRPRPNRRTARQQPDGTALVDARHPGLEPTSRPGRLAGAAGPSWWCNKVDKLSRGTHARHARLAGRAQRRLPVSAVTGEGLEELWTQISKLLSRPK
jgi:hypothetical protein